MDGPQRRADGGCRTGSEKAPQTLKFAKANLVEQEAMRAPAKKCPETGRVRLAARLMGAAALAVAAHSAAAPNPAAGTDPFKALEGRWQCDGYFVASGKPLSSDLDFSIDPPSGALIVRHDDRPPGAYHALELWSAANARGGFRATIADSYDGSRWFESAGWDGPALIWTRFEGGKAAEQFAYRIIAPNALQVDWSVSRGNAPLALGDRLNCARSAASSS